MQPVITSISPNTIQARGTNSFTITVRGVNFSPDAKVVFGGFELGTWLEGNVLKANILPIHYQNFSLGGVSVMVKQGGELSNRVSFNVTGYCPVTLNDLESLADAINTSASVNNYDPPKNPYIQRIDFVQVYRVKKEDTLQSIAKQVTGNPADWQVIAQINNLRYPFISDDPKVLMGNVKYTAVLTKKVFAGETMVSVNGASQFLTTNTLLFFLLKMPLSDGTVRLISDVVRVDKVIQDGSNPANYRLTLKNPIFNTYEAGHQIDVLATNSNTNLRVVTQGDFILVPSNGSKRTFVNGTPVSMSQVYEILGSDIWLDRNGNMREDMNGDFQSIIGLGNLDQAISHRLVTETYELTYHPEYGNPLIDYIGYVNGPTLSILCNQEIQKVMLQDPRIKEIVAVQSYIVGDTIQIKVIASVDVLNTTTEFNFVLPAR